MLKSPIAMTQPQDKPPNPLPTETDPRFPSGPWLGFWIQTGLGKQPMSLSLAFVDGRITGAGRDLIGPFDFTGTYDLKSGRVQMLKQYQQAHRVMYDGANQGDGLWLWGVWSILSQRGGFHLWPEGQDDPTQRHLTSEQELSAPASKSRLKLDELLPI